MIDVIQAITNFLNADATVNALVSGRIYDSELAESEDLSMPAKCIVLRMGGGPAPPHTLQINDRRLNVLCYGETDHLANSVYEAVYSALKHLTPTVQASTYIHWANATSGPIGLRDPVTQWPYCTSSWLVRVSDLTIA